MMHWLGEKLIAPLEPQTQRTAWGILCAVMGIVLNGVLFAIKFIAGTVSGSIAITADAFNNLSDGVSSAVTLAGFHWAGQKPDPHHPYGHGRIEYLSGLAVALLIVMMGGELAQQAISKILNPVATQFSPLVVAILVVSIAVKLYMYSYNKSLGYALESPAMQATATDSLSDVLATTTVLVATVAGQYTTWNVDGWCGLAVAVFVLYSGLMAGKSTIDPLLGVAPSPQLITQIRNIVLAREEVLSIHDLMIHDYGPGRMMISLHAEVPAEGNFLQLHDVIDQIEEQLRKDLQCNAVIHMDPIVTTDGITQPTAQKVATLMKTIDHRLSIHDFRMVAGLEATTKLIFDLVVPFDCAYDDRDLESLVQTKVQTINQTYRAAIHIERG